MGARRLIPSIVCLSAPPEAFVVVVITSELTPAIAPDSVNVVAPFAASAFVAIYSEMINSPSTGDLPITLSPK